MYRPASLIPPASFACPYKAFTLSVGEVDNEATEVCFIRELDVIRVDESREISAIVISS